MNKFFFTSDHHFGHTNIIRFCNRPFRNVHEMNEVMIQKWNEKIGPNDEVYHLGDFGLCTDEEIIKISARLNGVIYLITGNHERAALNNRKRFRWIKDYYELKVKDNDCKNGYRKIVLFHYAMRVWHGDYKGAWHLYGHTHGNLPDKADMLSFDVGVDCHDFYPLSYEDVKEIMKTKKWVPPFADNKI